MSAAQPPDSTLVEPDNYRVTSQDLLLCARLDGTLALCFYDAVQESGAMVHLRLAPQGGSPDPALTDTTLTSHLLLIDRALEELRRIAPRAQHWQARLLGQLAPDERVQSRFNSVRELLEGLLVDAGVKLVSCELVPGAQPLVRFRPAMGKAYAG